MYPQAITKIKDELYLGNSPVHIFLVVAIIAECSHRGNCDRANVNKPKVILYWTHFYGMFDFNFGFGSEPFKKAGCKVYNCVTTADRSQSHSADALLFHMRNINGGTAMPMDRSHKQRYVFFLQEHPYNQWNDLANWGGFFNLTMTYRLDSDIRLLYGRTAALEAKQSSESKHIEMINKRDDRKLVAWFVSNCNTHSKRELYVKELQKHIPVDIYGSCGPLKCPHDDRDMFTKRMDPACYKMLHENYKFYLSFENIHCKDYVTEKMYNIMNLDTIPVVMGGANYSQFAPPNSFIDIADFKSPKHLADRLLHLSNDPVEFWSYKDWRKTHRVIEVEQTWKEAFCQLCEVLNDNDYPDKVYHNLHDWWGKRTQCDRDAYEKMKHSWRDEL